MKVSLYGQEVDHRLSCHVRKSHLSHRLVTCHITESRVTSPNHMSHLRVHSLPVLAGGGGAVGCPCLPGVLVHLPEENISLGLEIFHPNWKYFTVTRNISHLKNSLSPRYWDSWKENIWPSTMLKADTSYLTRQ